MSRLNRLIAMNTKNITTSFKRRFLPRFSTKSRLLPLRGRGIERGRGRTQEKRVREVSRQSIRLNLTRMLTNVKNEPSYRAKFRNRPIETIDGYDKWSMMDRFQKYRDHRIEDGGPRCVALRCVIKRTSFRPLDLDLAVKMHRTRLNLGRYNPFNSARVWLISYAPRLHAIDACDRRVNWIQRPSSRHVACMVSRVWN